jgi:hypothetical protein
MPYFWDSEGSKEEANPETQRATNAVGTEQMRDAHRESGIGDKRADYERDRYTVESRNPRSVWYTDPDDLDPDAMQSVWTLSSEPTSLRHFATFPSELVRRCLSAGVSAGGCCAKCGAPWAAVVDSKRVPTRPGTGSKIGVPYGWNTGPGSHASTAAWQTAEARAEIGNRDPERHVAESTCLGYLPTCDCGLWAGKPLRPLAEATNDPPGVRRGCLVLDPFGGIGTTAQTARQLRHWAISIDLNPEYHKVALTRVLEPPRWWIRENSQRPACARIRAAQGQTRPITDGEFPLLSGAK